MNSYSTIQFQNQNEKTNVANPSLTDYETDFETDSEKKIKLSEYIYEKLEDKNMDESLCKALLKLYDDLHCISEQDFYNFIVNNIGVDMRIVCLINLMKKEKLSESENPL